MERVSICTICLRTNRKLKKIDTVLSAYHSTITNFSLQVLNTLCCNECEYLLRKTYKFHQKCLNATEILKTWLSSTAAQKALSTPVNMLHTKLPQTNLAMWTQQNSKVYNFVCIEKEDPPIVIDNINLDDDPPHQSPVIPENLKRESKDSKNIFQNDGTKLTPVLSGTTNILKKETPIQKKVCKIVLTRQPFIEIVPDINDILNKKDNNDVTTFLTPKVSGVLLNESLNASNASTENNDKSSDKIDEDDDVICLEDNDEPIDLIDVDEENNYPDDASLNSNDDCDDYLFTPPKQKRKRMTLDQLADIDLVEEDLAEDFVYSKETIKSSSFQTSLEKLIAVQIDIDSKIETITANLNSICENWEVTSLANFDVPGVPMEEIRSFIRKFLTDKELANKLRPGRSERLQKVKNKVPSMKESLDLINETCERVIKDHLDGQLEPKERLKGELSRRVERWGELKSNTGHVFDFDVIVNSLDFTPRGVIDRLLNYLRANRKSKSLIPGISQLLRLIENKKHLEKYKSVFDIEYMKTEKAAIEEFERRKTYECYVNTDFKCDICYQGYKNAGMLEYHKKYHAENAGPFQCHICKMNFASKKKRITHNTSHLVVYKCKLCPLVTYYHESMRNHYEQHKGTVFKCDKCSMTYKSKSVLNSHRWRAHLSGTHVCTLCGGAFISAAGLRTHRNKTNCGAIKPDVGSPSGEEVKCEICELTFASARAFHKHQLRLHRDLLADRPYRTRVTNTKRVIRKRPNMVCKVCNKVGHSYGWMVMHYGTAHPTHDVTRDNYGDRLNNLCDVCGKGFTSIYTLRNHIQMRHMGVTYPCLQCGKRYPSKTALVQHSYFHGPRKYSCDKCNKKFRSPSNLYNHKRSHIRNRPYKCKICGKGFMFRNSVREHIKGVHNHERRIRKRLSKRSRSIDGTPDLSETRNEVADLSETRNEVANEFEEGEPVYLDLGADLEVENEILIDPE